VCFFKPWWGAVTAILALALLLARPARRWRTTLAAMFAVALGFALLPAGVARGIDPFHDGQILSAVWEFETGRTLYAEVFPLRSFEFFVAWLFRQMLRPNVDAFFFGMGLLSFLPIGGACLLVFAWTRSLVWGFATGLVVATWPVLSGRMGVHLWMAAVAILVFRSRSRAALLWLPAASCMAGLLGFDVFVSFVCGITAAFLLAGPLPRREFATLRGAIAARLIAAGLAAAALVASFSLLVFIWQGQAAVAAYFELLLDNVRTYAAQSGLPLPWSEEWLRRSLVAAMVVIGLWTGWGVVAWRRLSRSRRAAWAFLLVQFVLLANRGLARSDDPHLDAVVFPSIAMSSLGLFELLRWLRRSGVRWLVGDIRTVAFAAAALACWLTPHGHITPRQFLEYAIACGGMSREPPASAFIGKRVATAEYLWEVENAMLNYENKRHNPTRQGLAYCISSPREQRVTIAALERRPPKLIAWQHRSGSNGIPNPLRFYVISDFVYRHYRPVENTWFLDPAGPDWVGDEHVPESVLGTLPLGLLPRRWGDDGARWLLDRRVASQILAEWQIAVARNAQASKTSVVESAAWELAASIPSREFNCLKVDLTCRSTDDAAACDAVLEFAPAAEDFEEKSAVTFRVTADGCCRSYLIPIGCSPGWSWRPAIDRLRLRVPDSCQLARPQAELWRVDFLRD